MTNPDELARKLADTTELRETLIQRAVLILEGASMEEAPVREGTLRRSLTSRIERDRGIVGTNLSYAESVHEGSRAHIIVPSTRKALAWPGAAHPVRSVMHPGTEANPFFARAIEQNCSKLEQMAADAGEQFFSKVSS